MKELKRGLSYLIPVGIVLAVVIVLLLIIGADIGHVLNSFVGGLFGNRYQVGEIFVKATPLLLVGLGCAIGFNCGFVNLGSEGQLYMGAIAATAVAVNGQGLPKVLLLLLMMLAGFVAGGIWSLVPGIMKAKFGLSEVIMGLMLNYIAIHFNSLAIRTFLKDPDYPFPMSEAFPLEAQLPILLERSRLHAGIVIAIVFAVAIWIFLWKSPKGFEIRACGCNPRASHCVGINVNRNLIVSSLFSGGMAGIAGFVEVAGVQHKLMDGISSNYGYLAIMVALLGKKHPFGVIIVSILLGMLEIGGLATQRQAGIPNSITSVILGVVVVVFLLRDRFVKNKQGALNV